MKKVIVISNTSFSIEKFREHYLNKINGYKFKIFTPYKKVKLKKNSTNLSSHLIISHNILYDLFSLHRLFKKEKTSLVISYSTYYNFLTSIISIFFNFKSISVIAGRGYLLTNKSFFIKILSKIIFSIIFFISNIIIFINPTDLKFFLKETVYKKKAYLIPTEGIEKKPYRIKKIKNKKNFIFFGRLIREKGILEYIELSKRIKKKYPHTNFFIAGPKDQSAIGQSKVDHKAINLIKDNNKFVKYIGFIKDYKKVFPKMDCLISPSYSEGAGTSVMEAMTSSLFVIAYKNSGHSYILKNTDNFITSKNDINNLFKLVEKYLNLDNHRLLINQKKSYNKVHNNFSSKIVASKFKKIIESA